MKLNKIFMLGLAGLAFAACSSEDETADGLMKGKKQIAVTIQAGDYAGTRAGSGWTDESGKVITANNIQVYFLNSTGGILEVKDAKVGANLYQNVSSAVTQIAATANCTVAATDTWNNVLATELEISSYGVASEAPLCSEKATLVPDGTADNTTGDMMYKAAVSLKTMLSRFELSGNLTCADLGTDAYTKLTLKHVGLNGVCPKFTLAGNATGYKVTDTSNQTGYPVLVPACFYDAVTAPEITTTAATALGPFGYNSLGKPDEFLLQFDTEFKNPITEGFVVYNPAYLKIVDYKTTEGGNVTIEPGKIYQITDLEFEEGDLTDLDPDEPTISVTATVSVVDWTIVPVEPEYGE